MRGTDSNAWLQAIVKTQMGGVLTASPANSGMFYAIVVDTDETNASLAPGTMRVNIPQVNGQQPYPPMPYPGAIAPPAGTVVVVAFSGFGPVPLALGFIGWQGNEFRLGFGVPDAELGYIGDVYLDVTDSIIYGPKSDTGWGTGYAIGSGATGASKGFAIAMSVALG
jgi:hypothetical protein